MRNQKVIAFYIGSLAKGGAERVVVNLAEYFYQIGYRVYVVTKLRETEEYEISDGILRVIADLTEEEVSENRLQNFFGRVKKLQNIWKEIRPDVIVSFIKKNNFMALASAKPLKIPVIVSVRSAPEREYAGKVYAALVRIMFAFADGIVLQTKDAMKYFPRYIRKKSVILPNSLNPAFIRPRFTGERRKEIVTVGRIDTNKNQKMLVEAFLDIAKDYPEWTCILYGDGEGKDAIAHCIKEHSEGASVILAGRQDRIQDKIYESSVFVLPSYCEGMPNALIEAMALGLAAISTDCPCGGPKDLIVDGVNGILIPVGDKEALKTALRKVMDSAKLREQLGVNAAQLADRLHPDKVNEMWKTYVESVYCRE